jgi:predicted dehydrogenase
MINPLQESQSPPPAQTGNSTATEKSDPVPSKVGKPLRLAMLGMIPGNGHPYSWSAIVNGYDPVGMSRCPYAMIPEYLGAQPPGSVGIPDASVTHIWSDQPEEADNVARAALIPNVVGNPMDVIGHVDGVIISTDDGEDHARRAAPFVEAGLPVFVDKPLATTTTELAQVVRWKGLGARILSSSGMRYATEIDDLKGGDWVWLNSATGKTLERYGIHALEPLFVLLGPGFRNVSCADHGNSCIATVTHTSGAMATFAVIPEAAGSFGALSAHGREKIVHVRLEDTYSAFRRQMLAVVAWMRGAEDPYPFAHTMELMAVLIAARESVAHGGAPVSVQSVLERTEKKTL